MRKLHLNENLEFGDLKRLVHNEIHIDEYKSKMGSDEEVIVISLKIAGKEPATDLVSFIEKGYDWVLDADVSSGEKEGGDYLVFIEIDRRTNAAEHIFELIEDICNLTEQSIEDWRFRYYKSAAEHELTSDNLRKIIPLSPAAYRRKFEKDEDSDRELDQLKLAAGVDVDTKAPVNDMTESLRTAAGIK